MAETAGSIIGVVQRRLGDPEGMLFTPTFCIGYINDAQIVVANRMRAAGIERFRKQSSAITIPSGSGYTELDRASTPALPADFIEPIQIWEKTTGAPDTDYRAVTLLRGDIQPYSITDPALRVYVWQGGKIRVQTPTGSVDILLDYVCSIGDMTSTSDTVPVYNTVTAIGFKAAALIAQARETPDPTIEADYESEMHNILAEANRFSQRKARRRRPFMARRFY